MDVTFTIDANGLLNVTAKDVRKGHSKSIVISQDSLSLPRDEIDRLIIKGEFERDKAARQKALQAGK